MIEHVGKWVGLVKVHSSDTVIIHTEDGWKKEFISKRNFYIKTVNFYKFENEFDLVQGRFCTVNGLLQMTVDK